jgi:hypothetical protein
MGVIAPIHLIPAIERMYSDPEKMHVPTVKSLKMIGSRSCPKTLGPRKIRAKMTME